MSIDRDDKFEGQEDSEYHFSDEEVSYEVEPEAAKAAPAAAGGGQKESLKTTLLNYKRQIVIIGVSLVLVFVLYKIMSGSSAPSTDITAAPVVAAQPSAMPANQAAVTQAAATQAPATQAAPIANPAQALTQSASVAPANQPPAAPVAAPQYALPSTIVGNAAQAAQQMQAQAVAQQQAMQQPSVAMPGQQNVPVVAALPAIIPVQSTPSVYGATNQPAIPPSMLTSMGAYIDARSAALNASSQKAIDDLHGLVTQQVNDFTTQNKALQDQVQTLNSQMAQMESQLNQLVQVLTRRSQDGSQGQGSAMANPAAPPQQVQAPNVKIAYNVQAIIPGRAWLKSENGETVTVAEGDMIKDVGRVMKIDPYDGVVEINTGSRSVSLSYGNGG